MDQENEGNGKKVLVAVVFLAVVGWFVYQNQSLLLGQQKEVAGVNTTVRPKSEEKIAIPQFNLQEKVQNIAQEVTKLDVKDVAASSPQVQKVLKDMESLKNLPKEQAKEACIKMCSNL